MSDNLFAWRCTKNGNQDKKECVVWNGKDKGVENS